MQQFTYTIQDPLGIHARPAGMLANTAKPFTDTIITIAKGDKSAKMTQLMRLLGLGVKNGDTVTVTADGPQEAEALAAIKAFFEKNL